MDRPKVSVIVGIYNCDRYLQDALNSLYSQTFKDFEIILCDDGSTDTTYQIALQNAKDHDNIVLIKNEKNVGLNVTLNNCLKIAKGEYIARMDGDDISLPTRFEKEVKFLDGHPEYAIVSTPMIYFDEQGEFGRGYNCGEPPKTAFINGSPFCHAPCMVRRSAYEAVGYYTVSPLLLRLEDYNLWMKMYALGLRGFNLDECLYAMRDDRNATIRRRSFKHILNSSYATFIACRTLKLPFRGYLSCFIPFIKFIIPLHIYEYFHKKKIRNYAKN